MPTRRVGVDGCLLSVVARYSLTSPEEKPLQKTIGSCWARFTTTLLELHLARSWQPSEVEEGPTAPWLDHQGEWAMNASGTSFRGCTLTVTSALITFCTSSTLAATPSESLSPHMILLSKLSLSLTDAKLRDVQHHDI
nr:hypothetical protein Iba_chr10eCG11730 [Ipomoea batatas]